MQRSRGGHGLGAKRKPKHVADVLSELFALKGYGRVQASTALEEHWRAVAGETAARHSRPGALRRGVLEVIVDNSVLLHELASFERATLLQRLQQRLPDENLRELRFRTGPLP